MNYIKDIDLKTKDNNYNVIVEIPKGTKRKLELIDKTFEDVVEVRKSLKKYICAYGCLPRTLAGDNDPADVFLISKTKHKSLDIVEAQPIAVIKTIDNGEEDNKIIMVEGAVEHLDKACKDILKFIKTYKGKKANMVVDETIYDVEDAVKMINISANRYNTKHAINTNGQLASF